jgi:hypothetical protein
VALLGGITSFLDKYILGYALGTAAGPALRPFVQDLANEAWTLNPVMRVDPLTAAAIVAEDVEQRAWGADEALNHGIDGPRFDAIVGEVLNAPGLPELYELWRRNLITDAQFSHGLRKGKLEKEWDAALIAARDVLLTPGELANARQQGFIDDARQLSEASLQGVDAERAEIQFELAGLPPGIETALQMLRRNIIDAAQFAEIVRTGHTKTKWTPELLALESQVLGAGTYAGLHLRGWIDEAAMVAGGKLTGHTQAQMDLLYKEHGRPATGHQVFIGLRRGGSYDGPTTGIAQPFIDAIRQSNIRPEWTNLLWAQRYTYPSAFVLRALAQGGDLTQAETEQILLFEGWEPKLAATVSAKWAGGTAATTDAHVGKAETQLWTTLHNSYKAEEIDAATAGATLGTLGVSATAQPQVLALWDAERALIRKQLSPAQIKKALKSGVANPATGAAWTFQEGIDALLARGYDVADATVLLEE